MILYTVKINTPCIIQFRKTCIAAGRKKFISIFLKNSTKLFIYLTNFEEVCIYPVIFFSVLKVSNICLIKLENE